MMLLALTIGLATSFAALVLGAMPPPDERIAVDLEINVQSGACPWGSADEAIQLRHRGGEPLPTAATTVRLSTQAGSHEWSAVTLGAPFETGGSLTIGETWTSPPVTIASGEVVLLDITSHNGRGHLVIAEALPSPTTCTGGP